MGIFFWDYNNENDIERQWVCFCLNIGVFLFTLFALVRTYQFHRKLIFEILPLSVNLIATFILLLLKLFEKGYQFDQIGYLLQIFTYFLFCYTFSIIAFKIKKYQRASQNDQTNNKQKISTKRKFKHKRKICNILFVVFSIVLITMIILVLTRVISKNCISNLETFSIILLVAQFLSYIPTIYFGKLILKSLQNDKKVEYQQKLIQAPEQSNIPSSLIKQFNISLQDQYKNQRRKQILFVLGIYTLSLFIRFFIFIGSVIISSVNANLIECKSFQDVFIITSSQPFGQFFLIMVQINQLLPHVIIPIAMYVVPVGRKRNKSFVLESSTDNDGTTDISMSNDDLDSNEYNNQLIKSKMSSLISDKASIYSPVSRNKSLGNNQPASSDRNNYKKLEDE